MADPFDNRAPGLESPAANAVEITPDDDNDLTTSVRGIYVGGDGDVKIDTVKGDTVTFSNVPAGAILPVRTQKVYETDTSATNLIGLY